MHASLFLACVASGCVTKSRYSLSAQQLPKACSDTPCMDTRIFVSISDWLVSYAPYDWSYSCKISKFKHCHVYFVFLLKARPCFAFEKVEKAMSDSSVYCNLCCRVIEKINERVLLSKRWKQFDVVSEIESLEISLRSTENKYVCRNCVAKLKKRRSLFEHTEKLEAELKSLSTSELSFSKTSKFSAMIPKLNTYFLYPRSFHSNATKT